MRIAPILYVSLLLECLMPRASWGADTAPAHLRPLRIAVWDFEAAAAEHEADGGSEALAMAAVLRRGLGQPERASANIERFFVTFHDPALYSDRAATLFLEEVIGEASGPEIAPNEAMLRRFLDLLPPCASPVVRLRAEVQLAAELWRKSCSAPGDDDACIKRIDASREYWGRSRAEAAAPNKPPRTSGKALSPCFTPPTFRYVVFPRLAPLANEAQLLAARAVARVSTLPSPPRADSPIEDALAHALFLLAEPHFEAALGLRLWKDLDHNGAPSKAQLLAWLNRRFRGTLGSGRGLGGLPEKPLYERVMAHSDSRWSAAARSRISQLLLDLNDQLFHGPAPIPKPPRAAGITPAEWAALFKDVICEPEAELPAADESLSACYAESARRLLDDPYARFCREAISQRHPAELNEAHEIYIRPSFEFRVSLSIASALKPPT